MFKSCVFEGSSLEGIDAQSLSVIDSKFDGSDFRLARLAGSIIQGSSMERCRFDNCRGSVRFTRCGLQGTSFASANLKDVGVVGCNARQASFRGAVLQDAGVQFRPWAVRFHTVEIAGGAVLAVDGRRWNSVSLGEGFASVFWRHASWAT